MKQGWNFVPNGLLIRQTIVFTAHLGDCVGQGRFKRLDDIHRCVQLFSRGAIPLIRTKDENSETPSYRAKAIFTPD